MYTSPMFFLATLLPIITASPIIPRDGACPSYSVVSGDTCWSIYTAHQLAPADFYKFNPSLSDTSCMLSIGQTVCTGAPAKAEPKCICTGKGSFCSFDFSDNEFCGDPHQIYHCTEKGAGAFGVTCYYERFCSTSLNGANKTCGTIQAAGRRAGIFEG